MSVAPPGSTVAAEAISHHTLVPLSTYLGIHLEGLAIDEEGMIPEALDEACRKGPIRAVFLQPSVINPTAALMSADRRQALAAVARQARYRHHRERYSRTRWSRTGRHRCSLRAGTHALRHELHQDHGSRPADRLSRGAGPLCRRRRQPASGFQLDGNARDRRDRHPLGQQRHGDGTGQLAAPGAGAAS
jgi:hypothetical protein